MTRVSGWARLMFFTVGSAFAVWAAAHGPDDRQIAARLPGGAVEASPGELDLPRPEVESASAPAPELDLEGDHEPLVGDRKLNGEIALDGATVHDGHYQVRLYDGSVAVLTLDPKVQKAAEAMLDRAKAPMGAVVVMATDGRILALAGRRNEPTVVERAFDLPVTVWAPAASVFKIVTATALVANGLESSSRACYHGGRSSVERAQLIDDPKRDRDCHDLEYAVSKSQNALIAKLADRHLDPDGLTEVAESFGFDEAPVFALDVEANRADIPTDALQFARVAAGFWSTELSPLGGALVANTIATGGEKVVPRIVDEIRFRNGTTREVVSEPAERVIDEGVATEVARMMRATTERGTAYRGFHDKRGTAFIPEGVAGKTGSLSRTEPTYLGYSWFVGFAPAYDPQVSIAVLLGNPRRWHIKAHTGARLVLDQLF